MKNLRVLAVVAVLPLLLCGCRERKNERPQTPRNVKVSTVEKTSATATKSYTGVITESKEANLAFMVAGKIRDIYVSEGDYVKEGQVVARMDDRDYRLQYDADLANYNQVIEEVKRVKEMHKRNNVSDNDYEKAIAGEKMITAKLKRSTDQLEDTELKAPFDGYIQRVMYSSNELVDAGMPVMSLMDISSLQVSIDIPASLYLERGNFLSFRCVPDIMPNESYKLKLRKISAKADNNLLYRAYFDLAEKTKLAPGMTVRVEITYNTDQDEKCLVPMNAVFDGDGNSYEWIVNPDGKSVEKRQVTMGPVSSDGNIYVTEGLSEGERVVSAGVGYIKENTPINIIETDSRTNVGNLL